VGPVSSINQHLHRKLALFWWTFQQ
jgi:hypothetical protein